MIKTGKIIELRLPDDLKRIAYSNADKMGKINNSILKGKGNEVGFLGEEVVKKFLKDQGEVIEEETFPARYNYDFIFNGKKCEVKTKQTTVTPKSNYDCSIADYNPNQECDYYIFTRIHEFWEKAWILGYMGKDEYFENAVFLKKGEIDPSNNYVVKADCYNVKISALHNIKELK